MPEQAGTQGRIQMVEMDLWKQAKLSGAIVRREDTKLAPAVFSHWRFLRSFEVSLVDITRNVGVALDFQILASLSRTNLPQQNRWE